MQKNRTSSPAPRKTTEVASGDKKQAEVKGKQSEVKSLEVALGNYAEDKSSTGAELDAVLKYLDTLKPQCETKVPSYAERKAKREAVANVELTRRRCAGSCSRRPPQRRRRPRRPRRGRARDEAVAVVARRTPRRTAAATPSGKPST